MDGIVGVGKKRAISQNESEASPFRPHLLCVECGGDLAYLLEGVSRIRSYLRPYTFEVLPTVSEITISYHPKGSLAGVPPAEFRKIILFM